MEHFLLRNEMTIPAIGIGTWQITDRDIMSNVVSDAYDIGYRLIDTAAAYSNEIAISKAIASKGISRNEILLSDKVWNTSRGYEAVQDACKKSLKKLKTEYFDFYLIHWPASMKLYPDWKDINAETWRGMERLYQDGYVKAIGVCNFREHHLRELQKTATIMPFINQFEMHPGMSQKALIEYCKELGIVVEASSPLGNGQILKNKSILAIARKKNKTSAQICLRWALQQEIVVIPKTVNANRLRQNIDVFDFELTDDEMKSIDDIPYCGGIGIDPDEVTQFG
ncbi:MAG: aldo/keto reductase [Lachnospiraceae bacterium]|nr:aldo/keto reductase [Lachnospiraceae bacterium]